MKPEFTANHKPPAGLLSTVPARAGATGRVTGAGADSEPAGWPAGPRPVGGAAASDDQLEMPGCQQLAPATTSGESRSCRCIMIDLICILAPASEGP